MIGENAADRVLKVGLTQWHATRDVARNTDLACRAVAETAAAGARLVLLPENGLMLGTNAEMREAAFAEDSPEILRLSGLAREHGVTVVLGGMKNRTPDGVFNSALILGPDGTVRGRYDKIHLFDARVGGTSFEASGVERAGAGPVLLDVDGVRVAVTICYDLRFPELYRAAAAAGAEVLLVPAAFTRITGEAHWEVLLRARAIENGAFVVASATVHGADPNADAFATYGHALAVGPWGEVLADLGDDRAVWRVVDLDMTEVARARTTLAVLRQRRPDAYAAEPRVVAVR
ncbi:nitrilase-related carbon-nitrogen hydrolase [Uniformispora flossi]|uniref:nitrilase-related carbon-nitrogen hydrolase n=1 Tax=Uniformispora flossi TaxID=3390723 RepID=UPI003C2FDC16